MFSQDPRALRRSPVDDVGVRRDSLSSRCLWVQLRHWDWLGPRHPQQYLWQGWHSPSWSAYRRGGHVPTGRTQRPSPSSL